MSAVLEGRLCRLRPYRTSDVKAMCAVADDFMVARWMTRAFPHPYAPEDAQQWIEAARSGGSGRHYAIEVDGVLVGGAGFEPFSGERSGTAAVGYWLGRAYWGRGLGSDAARTLCDEALGNGGLRRLEARVFAEDVPSAKVLEKCGFVFEGRLRAYYVDREEKICDALLYARTHTLF